MVGKRYYRSTTEAKAQFINRSKIYISDRTYNIPTTIQGVYVKNYRLTISTWDNESNADHIITRTLDRQNLTTAP